MLKVLKLLLLVALLHACYVAADDGCRVAIVGGGVGGTSAAYYLQRARPDCAITLYERKELGGRVKEFKYNGKTFELGASIIHARNQYMLEAIDALNLTAAEGDDTQSTFSIFNGNSIVYTQDDGLLGSLKALARYGLAPLRFSSLSIAAGRRFGSIYGLQEGGTWFRSPDEMLGAMGLLDLTMSTIQEYGESHLSWWWRWGAAAFLTELVGAVNRINYNQHNQELNALAGLVSFLPAAEPLVYSVAEGNAEVARRFASAANLAALHLGSQVEVIRALPNGTWQLVVSPPASDNGDASHVNHEVHGPYGAVILAAPLEAGGVTFEGFTLPPITARQYQHTVTTYVTGVLNPAYFGVEELPEGDIFVTNTAPSNFTVLAVKGPASSISSSSSSSKGRSKGSRHKAPGQCFNSWIQKRWSSWMTWLLQLPQRLQGAHQHMRSQQQQHNHHQHHHHHQQGGHTQHADSASSNSKSSPQQTQQELHQQQAAQAEQDAPTVQLFKMFSELPLCEAELSQMFLQHEVVAHEEWKAYPKYSPPEELAPFLLAPGLVYNNALEAAASAMEVALVAARNSVLLVTHHLQQHQKLVDMVQHHHQQRHHHHHQQQQQLRVAVE